MIIGILDYADKVEEANVGELDDIKEMKVDVITGDEILHVVYKDGREVFFDASNDRLRNFYDGWYMVFDDETNILEDPEWLNRTHYSWLREHGDCSEADKSDWW